MNVKRKTMAQNQESVSQRGSWRIALLAGLLTWITCAYFINTRPGWNVNSQFALANAIAERGTLQIDGYHDHRAMATGDKAYFEGHYYSDKSPVLAFMGAPWAWLHRQASQILDRTFSYGRARYWVTLMTVGLSAGLFAFLLTVALAGRGIQPNAAGCIAFLWIAATPLLGYSVLFMNYLPACLFILAGFMLIDPVWRRSESVRWPRMLGGGFLIGLACWTLNTVGIVAVVLTIGLILHPWWIQWNDDKRWRRLFRALWPWALGGILGASGYVIYSFVIFGHLTSPYRYEVDPLFQTEMAKGLMGATIPRLDVAFLTTFHPFQGLFLWFPWALIAFLGCLAALAKGDRALRLEAAAAILIFALFLAYNSAYYMWWGGWAYAPRNLLPALALMPLGFVLVFKWARGKKLHYLIWGIGLAGALVNSAAVAVDPQVPPGLPLEKLLYPDSIDRWTSPMLALQRYFWQGHISDGNWGTRFLGLKEGPVSLIPLWMIWILGWWGMVKLPWQNGNRTEPQQGD